MPSRGDLEGPPGYQESLMRYLHRLGSRADHLVLCGHGGISKVLGDAGYKVETAPPPDELAAAVARAEAPVIGVVVDAQQGPAYVEAARAVGAGDDLVLTMANASAADQILAALDERL